MFKKIKAGIACIGSASVGLLTKGLIVTATGVQLEATDITTINDANTAYLNSAFQIVELLPYIAVFSGGMYILNKMFSIIPKTGSGN